MQTAGKVEKYFYKMKTFLQLPLDKVQNMVYNIKLHYNRLVCPKMGPGCFGTAVYILILYENIIFYRSSEKSRKDV